MRLLIVLFVAFMHSAVLAHANPTNVSFTDTASTIITVITIVVALVTFGITLIIPIALRVYRRYHRGIRDMNVQVEMVRKIEDLMYQYEVDILEFGKMEVYNEVDAHGRTESYNEFGDHNITRIYMLMARSRLNVRKHLQNLLNPPAHDVVASQRLACFNLAQLVTNSELIWPRKLKSLIRFMRVSGLLSNELLRSKEYKKKLIVVLKDFAEDDSYGESVSRYTMSETMFKDFVYGFLVLLSILLVLALIVNGGEMMTSFIQVITTWLIQITQVIDGLVGWLIKVIKDML